MRFRIVVSLQSLLKRSLFVGMDSSGLIILLSHSLFLSLTPFYSQECTLSYTTKTENSTKSIRSVCRMSSTFLPSSFSLPSSSSFTLQDTDTSEVTHSSSSDINLYYTITLENKTKALAHSTSSSFQFSRGSSHGWADFIKLSHITEESGFLFDGKIRVRITLIELFSST